MIVALTKQIGISVPQQPSAAQSSRAAAPTGAREGKKKKSRGRSGQVRDHSGSRSRSSAAVSARSDLSDISSLGQFGKEGKEAVHSSTARPPVIADAAANLLAGAGGPSAPRQQTSNSTRLDVTSDWKLSRKELSEDALRKMVVEMGLMQLSFATQLNMVKAVAIFSTKLPAEARIVTLVRKRTSAFHAANKQLSREQRAKQYPPFILAVDGSIEAALEVACKKEPEHSDARRGIGTSWCRSSSGIGISRRSGSLRTGASAAFVARTTRR